MNVQDWGAIGELPGSIVVLITLVYLAIQTRSSWPTLKNTGTFYPEFIDLVEDVINAFIEDELDGSIGVT